MTRRTTDAPVHMLAADHRWQWEEWCDRNGVAHDRIPETKRIALDGLLAVTAQSPEARATAAFLVDAQYAASEVERAKAAGIFVGTPVEKPGVFPIEWSSDPFWTTATGDFVKVLVRHRPEWPAQVQRDQLAKLKTLGDWCEANGRVFLLEVVVMPGPGETEEAFEAEGRPSIVAAFIRDAYAEGIVPDYWKIEGTTVGAAMEMIDAAITERDRPRMVILGKGAGFDLIGTWFRVASLARSAAGFAIGRSVYLQPSADYLLGKIDRDTAVSQVAANYQLAVRHWEAGQAAVR